MHDLDLEILESERVRTRVLMGILGYLFLVALGLAFVPGSWNVITRLAGERFPWTATIAFYALAFLYELGMYVHVGRAIARRFDLSALARYGNALVETSMPTIMLALLVHALGPALPLNSPLVMVYFVFISLSTLRLAAPLSLFTGCVAAAEYVVLGFFTLPAHGAHQPFFTSLWPIVGKSFVMVGAGAVCAFVGAQLRRRIVASLESLREKNRVVGLFGQYVSPAVVERLLHQSVGDRGEVRFVTIMFLDIRDYTSYAEHRTPQEVVDYLNTLFGALITIVNAHHGIINKFLGDGFMACFGAPLSDGRDVEHAVGAAMDIAAAVERMNAERVIPPTRIGMGLHAGEAVTGSVGSDERKEYTIIGDTVNLASRVEQLNKPNGSVLLVTDAVWQVVKAKYPGRALAPAMVKGRDEPVAIYALL